MKIKVNNEAYTFIETGNKASSLFV